MIHPKSVVSYSQNWRVNYYPGLKSRILQSFMEIGHPCTSQDITKHNGRELHCYDAAITLMKKEGLIFEHGKVVNRVLGGKKLFLLWVEPNKVNERQLEL